MGYFRNITIEQEITRIEREMMVNAALRGERPVNQREERRVEIEKLAKDACARLGGHAQISERFSIIDTNKYTIVEKQ